MPLVIILLLEQKFNNGFQICWLYLAQYSDYAYTWTFPQSFKSSKYTVQVTHYSNQSTDQTTKINTRKVSNCLLQGNQYNMHVTALAVGY